jgi:hypothetical protein
MALATTTTPGSIILGGDLTGVANAPELRVTGVTAGTYTPGTIVIDAKGRLIYADSITLASTTTSKGAISVSAGNGLTITSAVLNWAPSTATNTVAGIASIPTVSKLSYASPGILDTGPSVVHTNMDYPTESWRNLAAKTWFKSSYVGSDVVLIPDTSLYNIFINNAGTNFPNIGTPVNVCIGDQFDILTTTTKTGFNPVNIFAQQDFYFEPVIGTSTPSGFGALPTQTYQDVLVGGNKTGSSSTGFPSTASTPAYIDMLIGGNKTVDSPTGVSTSFSYIPFNFSQILTSSSPSGLSNSTSSTAAYANINVGGNKSATSSSGLDTTVATNSKVRISLTSNSAFSTDTMSDTYRCLYGTRDKFIVNVGGNKTAASTYTSAAATTYGSIFFQFTSYVVSGNAHNSSNGPLSFTIQTNWQLIKNLVTTTNFGTVTTWGQWITAFNNDPGVKDYLQASIVTNRLVITCTKYLNVWVTNPNSIGFNNLWTWGQEVNGVGPYLTMNGQNIWTVGATTYAEILELIPRVFGYETVATMSGGNIFISSPAMTGRDPISFLSGTLIPGIDGYIGASVTTAGTPAGTKTGTVTLDGVPYAVSFNGRDVNWSPSQIGGYCQNAADVGLYRLSNTSSDVDGSLYVEMSNMIGTGSAHTIAINLADSMWSTLNLARSSAVTSGVGTYYTGTINYRSTTYTISGAGNTLQTFQDIINQLPGTIQASFVSGNFRLTDKTITNASILTLGAGNLWTSLAGYTGVITDVGHTPTTYTATVNFNGTINNISLTGDLVPQTMGAFVTWWNTVFYTHFMEITPWGTLRWRPTGNPSTLDSATTMTLTDGNLFASIANFVSQGTRHVGIGTSDVACSSRLKIRIDNDIDNNPATYSEYAVAAANTETYGQLVTAINATVSGYNLQAAMFGGNLRISSTISGVPYKIAVVDYSTASTTITTGAIPTLTGYTGMSTPVNGAGGGLYRAIIYTGFTTSPVSTTIDSAPLSMQTFADVINVLNTALGSNGSAALVGGNIRIYSNGTPGIHTGLLATQIIPNTQGPGGTPAIFETLAGFTGYGTSVQASKRMSIVSTGTTSVTVDLGSSTYATVGDVLAAINAQISSIGTVSLVADPFSTTKNRMRFQGLSSTTGASISVTNDRLPSIYQVNNYSSVSIPPVLGDTYYSYPSTFSSAYKFSNAAPLNNPVQRITCTLTSIDQNGQPVIMCTYL